MNFMPKKLDLIWNITLVCPWNCIFCCTDAVNVVKEEGIGVLYESSLQNRRQIDLFEFRDSFELLNYYGIKPNIFDLALVDRQKRGFELNYSEKISLINKSSGYSIYI